MNVRNLLLIIFFLPWVNYVYASDFTNFLGMEFNKVPAGFFFMGSCKPVEGEAQKNTVLFGLVSTSVCASGGSVDMDAKPDELPQHKVEIPRPFYLGIYEVTRAQFMAYATKVGRSVSENFKKYNSHGDNAAVIWVSWYQAQGFIDWLNQNKANDDEGKYRLPTEAEWEYAARAGSTSTYFFGDKSLQISRYAWIIKDSQSYGDIWSQPVGIKKSNPWGFFDIYGNAQEWVQDIYDENFYQKSPTTNPKGPNSGRDQVVRGCCLYHSAKNCRSATRYHLASDQTKGTVGFRVVREIP